MNAQLIDGNAIAAEIKAQAAREIQALQAQDIFPRLVVFLVGEDPASSVYVRGKERDCVECMIESKVVRLAADTTQEELLRRIEQENNDPDTHGILVQLPLPPQIEATVVIEALNPAKDVDGFTAENVGRLYTGRQGLRSCTPAGCIEMLQRTNIEIAGKNAVVIGRSNIVGKPMAEMLTQHNATVTLCHSKTADLEFYCRNADILVVAAGMPGLVCADMIKPGAAVIDVGINRGQDGKLHGDVDFEAASAVAGYITPVPGGVGPVTRAMLIHNTVLAARRQTGAE